MFENSAERCILTYKENNLVYLRMYVTTSKHWTSNGTAIGELLIVKEWKGNGRVLIWGNIPELCLKGCGKLQIQQSGWLISRLRFDPETSRKESSPTHSTITFCEVETIWRITHK
jgi:hypothetical protein